MKIFQTTKKHTNKYWNVFFLNKINYLNHILKDVMSYHLKIYFFILLKSLLKSHNFDTRLLEMGYFEKSLTALTPTYIYIYIYTYICIYKYIYVYINRVIKKYIFS